MKKLMTMAFLSSLICGFVYAGDLKISGGAAPMNNILKRIQAPMKDRGVNLILEETGPEIALSKLDKGEIDAAVAGLSLNDFFNLAQEKNITLKTPKDKFVAETIGMDRVKIIVNPKIGVKNLSADQLKGIFSGKTKNWKEVGGADIPIHVIWGEKIGGTNKTFEKAIMGGEKVVPSETTGTVVEIASKVAAKDGSVGLCVAGGEFKGVDFPQVPDIKRPISLVTIGAPNAEIMKVIKYIADERK